MDDDGIETDAWAADHGPAADALLPASAAWREGDNPGRRRFLSLGDLPLEADPIGALPGATLAYETWGQLNSARDNAIYVAHALTGDSHVWGPSESGHHTGGWWNAMVGPGRPIDPERHFVVSANVLGGCQGSSGPASAHPDDGKPWGSRFPYVTLRDMVAAEIALADHLGVGIGGGSSRVRPWAACAPSNGP